MSTQKVLAIKIDVQGKQAQQAITAVQSSIGGFSRAITNVSNTTSTATSKIISSLFSWQTAVAGVIASVGGLGLGRAILGTANAADEFGEKMRQMEMSAKELSTLQFVGSRINTEFDTLADTITKADVALQRLRANGIRQFQGVSLVGNDGRGRSTIDVVRDMGRQFERFGYSQAERRTAFAEVFGDRQSRVLDRLASAGNLQNYQRLIDSLGGPTTERAVAAGTRVADAVDNISFAWRRVKEEAVVALDDTITPLLNNFATQLGSLPESVRGVGSLMRTAGRGGANQRNASDDLAAITGISLEFAGGALMGLAKSFGTTIIETMRAGLYALTPVLSDVVRDAVAPIANPVLGAFGKPLIRTSYASQIADTENAIRVMQQQQNGGFVSPLARTYPRGGLMSPGLAASRPLLIAAMSNPAVNDALSGVVSGITPAGAGPTAAMYLQSKGVLAMPSGSPDLLQANLKELRAKQAAEQRFLRDNAIAQVNDSLGVISQTWKDYLTGVNDDLKFMQDALKRANELYSGGEPSEPTKQAVDVIGRMLDDQRRFSMMSIMNGFGAIVGGAGPAPQATTDIRGATFIRERRQVMAELEARRAAAFGNEGAAASMRTELANAEQRNQLFEKYGEAARSLLPTLNAVQDAESRRMGLDAKLTRSLKALGEAQAEYNSGVQFRAAQVTAGIITQAQARAADDVAGERFLAAQRETASSLERLQRDYPEFARMIGETTREVTQSAELLSLSLQRVSRGDWRAGFRAGLEDIRLQAEDVFTFTRDLTMGVANTMATGFSTAFTNIVNGTSSVKDAFRDLASNVLNYIAQMTMQMLVFRAIAGIAGSFAGGTGGANGLSLGGAGGNATASGMSIPSASRGLNVFRMPGVLNANGNAFDRGNVVAFAQGGVVTRPTLFGMSGGRTGLMGEAGPEAIVPLARTRRGKMGIEIAGGAGGITIAPVVNVTINTPAGETSKTGTGAKIGREVATAVVDAILRDPNLRLAIRGA